MSADTLARRSAEAMFERDRASQGLGMMIEEVREGYARLSMTVRGDMLNGYGACHGGLIFALADSAFAFSCNSRNRATVVLRSTTTDHRRKPPVHSRSEKRMVRRHCDG